MTPRQQERLEVLRYKPDLTDKEWEEYQKLVNLQYETGENDPKPDVVEEKPNG